MDWETFLENIGIWYNVFIEWYLEQPLYGQVLAIIGIITLLALAVTLLYFIIKGIAYLIYYTIKGIYYLLKYIGYGIFRLFEGFYLLVSGKSKSKSISNHKVNDQNNYIKGSQVLLEYCSECGKKISEKMKTNFEKNGMTFCENCGKHLTLSNALKTLVISH